MGFARTVGVTLLLCAVVTPLTHASDAWKYADNDPAHWLDNYEDCGKDRQSPINIDSESCVYEEDLESIALIETKDEANKDLECFEIINNGHTVKISLKDMKEVFIVGGDLGDLYRVAQFHFHWGASNDKGSEHAIDQHKYPLEMHIVTYDTDRFSDLSSAASGYNSLAVLGVMFEISEEDNAALAPIIAKFADITESGSKVPLSNIDLTSLLPSRVDEYYRYEGSLTTPPCYESVKWTVFKTPQKISESQMAQFRSLQGDAIVDNFRPLQELNERKVHCSFEAKDEDEDSKVVGYRGAGGENAAAHVIASKGLLLIVLLAANKYL